MSHRHTPDSSGKPAGCAAPEDLERIAGIGPKNDHPVSSRLSRDDSEASLTPPREASRPLRGRRGDVPLSRSAMPRRDSPYLAFSLRLSMIYVPLVRKE